MEVTCQIIAPAALTQGIRPRYPLNRWLGPIGGWLGPRGGWLGPRAGVEFLTNRKHILPLHGFESKTVQSVVLSLQMQHCLLE
jgi:hypothetical protein